MRTALFVLILPVFSNALFSQSLEPYIHPSTLGVEFVAANFQATSAFKNLDKADAGLAIGFLKGINPHLDYTINLSACFPDSVSSHVSSGTKSLLLQSDISLRARLRGRTNWINPFIQGGIGLGTYQSTAHSFLLVGPGLEFNYRDVYVTTTFQYRASLTDKLNSYYFYSVGISGLIGKKQKRNVVVKNSTAPPPNRVRDSDGDGIVDSVDACPTIPGLAKYHGCPMPDRDKDGIPDEEDRCPDVAGVPKYHGCPIPDTDGDGINDEEDSCVTVPGVRENHGCPLVKKGIKEAIDFAAKHIFFKTGSYELLEKSFLPLDQVAQILVKNPSLALTIEGHTDNVGTSESNQILSKNRANAVMRYLLSKGINKTRLTSVGYGQSQPIDSNLTSEGRANNRRVELKLNYKP